MRKREKEKKRKKEKPDLRDWRESIELKQETAVTERSVGGHS